MQIYYKTFFWSKNYNHRDYSLSLDFHTTKIQPDLEFTTTKILANLGIYTPPRCYMILDLQPPRYLPILDFTHHPFLEVNNNEDDNRFVLKQNKDNQYKLNKQIKIDVTIGESMQSYCAKYYHDCIGDCWVWLSHVNWY